MITQNEMNDLLIDKGWYHELDYSKVTEISQDVDIKDWLDFGKITFDMLNDFTRKKLSEIYNDPSDDSYYTPQQLAKIKVEKMISEDEIGGALYKINSTGNRLLELECDSDTYTLAVKWFINLDTLEATIK